MISNDFILIICVSVEIVIQLDFRHWCVLDYVEKIVVREVRGFILFEYLVGRNVIVKLKPTFIVKKLLIKIITFHKPCTFIELLIVI